MTQNNAPRLLLAGTGSGCGKTTVTTAILRALQRRGVSVHPFLRVRQRVKVTVNALGLAERNVKVKSQRMHGVRLPPRFFAFFAPL